MHSNAQLVANSLVFDVRDYGAVGDGTTLDTVAIQAAIDACNDANGGCVALLNGVFVAGTLRLCSNIELHIGENTVLLGTPDKDLYSGPRNQSGSRDAASRWLHAFLIGEGIENVSFTGEGVIDGNNVFDPEGEEHMRGPHTVLLRHCRNVTLQDLTIRNSPNYAFFFYANKKVRVENATFEGGWDGIHFRDLDGIWNSDVRIANSRFFTGDDSIAGACIENATIENCLINSSCNGLRLIGPARRWSMKSCRFQGPGVYPHRLKNRYNMLVAINVQPGAWEPWPGPLQDVHFSDIEMDNVQCAFHVVVREGNTGDNITLERISATLSETDPEEAASSIESWQDAPIRNVVCRDISILASGGGNRVAANLPIELPHVGARPLPVWGLYARGVEALQLERIELVTRKPDARLPQRFDEVTELQRDAEVGTPLVPQVAPEVPTLESYLSR